MYFRIMVKYTCGGRDLVASFGGKSLDSAKAVRNCWRPSYGSKILSELVLRYGGKHS